MYTIAKVFFDEGSTDGKDHIMVLAFAAGTVSQWQHFEHAFAKRKRKFGIVAWEKKNQRPFHASEVRYAAKIGEFPADQWNKFCDSFPELLPKLMFSGIVSMDVRDYDFVFPDRKERRALSKVDSKYGVCFRRALRIVVEEIFKRYPQEKPEIWPIAEEVKGGGVATDLVMDFRKNRLPRPLQSKLRPIAFEPKGALPLQVADMIAYATGSHENTKIPANSPLRPRAAVEDKFGPFIDKTFRARIKREDLEELKRDLVADASSP